MIPLLLAWWGATAGVKRRGVLRWLLFAVFALLFVVGPRTPVYTLCQEWIPGMPLFRAPTWIMFLVSILIATHAAIDADELQSGRWKQVARFGWGLLGAAAGVLLSLTVTVWRTAEPARGT